MQRRRHYQIRASGPQIQPPQALPQGFRQRPHAVVLEQVDEPAQLAVIAAEAQHPVVSRRLAQARRAAAVGAEGVRAGGLHAAAHAGMFRLGGFHARPAIPAHGGAPELRQRQITKPASIREKGRKEGVSEAAEQPNRRGKGRNRTRCGAREPSPRSPVGRAIPDPLIIRTSSIHVNRREPCCKLPKLR